MSEVKSFAMTKKGKEELEEELDLLKTIKRKEVAEKIKLAMSFGDLSENSEYDEAKNEQAKMEARIADIETMLKNVKIIDEAVNNTSTVNLGSRILLLDMNSNKECEYRIVGSSESNPARGLISNESPVGKALIGHKVDEIVKIETLIGIEKYKILKII